MKAVMLSIKPKYCELIASGKKTIEVRKSKPRIETPFKCYIYCTKEKHKGKYLHTSNKIGRLLFWHNKGDCEVICQPEDTSYTAYACNGKVIGEFVCDAIIVDKTFGHDDLFNAATCLSIAEAAAYCTKKGIYGWHISDLVIYDKPKELSEFYKHDNTYDNAFGWVFEDRPKKVPIKRPPQSWCYVEEV